MHNPSDEVTKPEHGGVLNTDCRLAAVVVLQGVPHGRVSVQFVFMCVDRVVCERGEAGFDDHV